MRIHFKPIHSLWLILAGTAAAVLALFIILQNASASATLKTPNQASPLHPVFALLDENGGNVLKTGLPVSTLKTCGTCHDSTFIVSHNFHSDLGLADIQSKAKTNGQPWDSSNGVFGKWDPLTYRYLSQPGDSRLDLGTPEWLMLFGSRAAGSGPASTSRSGSPLNSIKPDASNPETSLLDPNTSKTTTWDWSASGTEELDCFLCHLPQPNNNARSDMLKAGLFKWANTATLLGTGLVNRDASGNYAWNATAFDEEGKLLPENVTIQSPSNENCSQCHGIVDNGKKPLVVTGCSLDNPQTAETGQIISSGKISASGVNLAGKDTLSMAWDIHAERQLNCVDCHYSLNNPVAYQESSATKLTTLLFDPRRLDFGDYLKSPDHNLARGQSAQFTIDPALKGSMRRCDSCHAAQEIHSTWLPYTAKHLSTLACETCHIPQMYAPAIQSYDWTVISLNSSAEGTCRGVDSNGGSITDLVTGFQPVLMERSNVDGTKLVAPYNLVTTWYWTYQDNGNTRPVRLADLQAVYLQDGKYAPEILKAFDYDGNGSLSASELRLDTTQKTDLVASRLTALGLKDVKIAGTVQPYSINHGVMAGNNAISDCSTCHTANSRLAKSMQLADYLPGGILPIFAPGTNVDSTGSLVKSGNALIYQPKPSADQLYIFGFSHISWVDWLGGLFFLAVLLGIAGHATLRMVQNFKMKKDNPELHKVVLYQPYERFWHWLQTALILILLVTGLIIHRPDLFGWLSFRGLVTIHNVSAATLAINALLSLFYHLTTGQIRSFFPRPYGFFDDAIEQTKYYLRGIFKHAPHPFEKTPERKMNPLQQVTYLGILNVLLPLQGITGILMWGAQRWSQVADSLGGLPNLATFHSLLAWLFAAFILGHVYLTTTGGQKPLDSIKAMVTGWEAVEVHKENGNELNGTEEKK